MGKAFRKLLDNPHVYRMLCDVEVQNAPGIMAMMKKQESTAKVIVETLKESVAAIASRRLRREVNQRLARSESPALVLSREESFFPRHQIRA